jgi:hypothetical protein
LLGARLAQKGGATQAGILFLAPEQLLANMYESTDDKDGKKTLYMGTIYNIALYVIILF